MSRFFNEKYRDLTPYTPGEQPTDMSRFTKLNTNESPFPPSEKAMEYAKTHTRRLNLYSELGMEEMRGRIAELNGLRPEQVMMANGSDEALYFAFLAFCDEKTGVVFPDITYGFYRVYADLLKLPYTEIPLAEDFTVRTEDYLGCGRTVFIANPNAPTGIELPLSEIERILRSNPDNVVVIDEAYVDFGGTSAVSLIDRYENLLVVQTFSKSRSLAGARLGFLMGSEALIRDLQTVRYSISPYNVNSMTLAIGLGMLYDEEYRKENCRIIEENRDFTVKRLKNMGFTVLPSKANFIFAKSDRLSGEEIYLRLKEKDVLVRHFTIPRIKDFNRITIGTTEQMTILFDKLEEILKEES